VKSLAKAEQHEVEMMAELVQQRAQESAEGDDAPLLGGAHPELDRRTAVGQERVEPVELAIAAARSFVKAGARWIHVVDMDLALDGEFSNLEVMAGIAALGASVQASVTRNGLAVSATLFVKTGDEYVRVSTNVPKPDGSGRATGTILDPKGKAIVAINKGEAFYGEVTILDVPYITGYEPIKDASGKVIGIYYVGYKK